jgi:hypothetical protein
LPAGLGEETGLRNSHAKTHSVPSGRGDFLTAVDTI